MWFAAVVALLVCRTHAAALQEMKKGKLPWLELDLLEKNEVCKQFIIQLLIIFQILYKSSRLAWFQSKEIGYTVNSGSLALLFLVSIW